MINERKYANSSKYYMDGIYFFSTETITEKYSAKWDRGFSFYIKIRHDKRSNIMMAHGANAVDYFPTAMDEPFSIISAILHMHYIS